MADLEERLLGEDKTSNPVKYHRYVDDICIFRSKSHIHHFIRRLERNSVLGTLHPGGHGRQQIQLPGRFTGPEIRWQVQHCRLHKTY